MTRIRQLLWNPIVTKEIHSRMRSLRTAVVIVAYLSVLGMVAYLAYRPFGGSSGGVDQATRLSQAGLTVFAALGATVLLLIGLIVPGLVGGAISGERERQTLDLLLCTPVRPLRIVIGKLLASLLFVLFLVVASVPVFAVALLLGGVTVAQVAVLVALCLTTAVVLGALAMLCSVAMRGTGTPIVASYVAAAVIAVVPNLAAVISPPRPVFSTSPGPLSSVAIGGTGSVPSRSVTTVSGTSINLPWVAFMSPFTASASTLSTSVLSGYSRSCASGSRCPSLDILPDGAFGGWRAWQVFLLVDTIVAVLALGASVLLLRSGGPGIRRRARQRPDPGAAAERSWSR